MKLFFFKTSLILIFLVNNLSIAISQTIDSLTINELSEGYIEIILPYETLYKDSFGLESYIQINLTPFEKIKTYKNGIVLIKNHSNRLLSVYIIKNSIIIHQQHFNINGEIIWEESIYDEFTGCEKYYGDDGTIKQIIYWNNGDKQEWHFDKK